MEYCFVVKEPSYDYVDIKYAGINLDYIFNNYFGYNYYEVELFVNGESLFEFNMDINEYNIMECYNNIKFYLKEFENCNEISDLFLGLCNSEISKQKERLILDKKNKKIKQKEKELKLLEELKMKYENPLIKY